MSKRKKTMTFSLKLCSFFIHPQLKHIVAKMTLLDTICFYIVHLMDKFMKWHRLPVLLGLAYLGIRRYLHQRYNLVLVGRINGQKYDTQVISYRTADGKCNHPTDDLVGSQGTFFGRNMPPSTLPYGLMEPDPTVVAAKLMERRKYVDTGKQLNMIACTWIQFMIHDWVDHMEDTHQQVEIKAAVEVAERCPLKSFKFFKSKQVSTENSTGFLNIRTPWWDGSVIYGNNEEGMNRVRSFKEGKLKIFKDGLLEHDDKGIPISGDVRNSWAGFSLLQALFVKEHNSVCELLKKYYPNLDDEKLYQHARLVTSAVIAKIHTIDWTVQLLKTDTLLAGMRINWYGFFGKKLKDMFGHIGVPVLSGLVGLKKPIDHGIPFSLTEEFVSVYRMHSLLPERFLVRDINSNTSQDNCPPIQEEVPMRKMIGKEGEVKLSKIGMEKMLVSMGHQSCGAVTLWNYPSWMRNVVVHDIDGDDRPDPVDMAALEIYRDRERKIARYNEFRRNMLMIPISKWEDLTDDNETIASLREVYGNDVEKLDLQIGLHAEKKIKGFAISETAFFIFLLVASRRLEADRFFTTNFNTKTYTEKGLEWVNKTETLKDVIDRHFPQMTVKWMKCSSAFSVWSADPTPDSYLPLYLRPAP